MYIDQRGTKASAEYAAWLTYQQARAEYAAHGGEDRRAVMEVAHCRWQRAWAELHAASEAHRAYEATQRARLNALFADGAPSHSLAAQLAQGGDA